MSKSVDELRHSLPEGFPTIVCLCGSTRFGKAFRDAQREETLAGKIVLSVGLLGHEEGIDMNGPVKAMLDRLHFRKIELADEVLILDAPAPWCSHCEKFRSQCYDCETSFTGEMRPYIGESTRRELDYAKSLGKSVRFLSESETE